jgi:hypothetical protein
MRRNTRQDQLERKRERERRRFAQANLNKYKFSDAETETHAGKWDADMCVGPFAQTGSFIIPAQWMRRERNKS